jgi:type IX secretion system PorP/SprF family membrane protein
MSKGWRYLILILVCANTFAQQKPQYAQYLQNNFLINPALAGLESYADIRLGYRKQWIGLTSSPTTYYLTGHLPIGNPEFERQPPATPRFVPAHRRLFALPERHFGLGFSMVRDQAGPLSNATFDLAAAYHYPLTDNWQLSTGIAAGLTQYVFDFDNIHLKNPIDPLVSQGKVAVFRPNLNVGLWLYSANFFAGFAVQQLAAGTLKFKGSNQDWTGQLVPHYFLTIGGRLELSDEWAFVPSVLFKTTTNTTLSFDLNLKIDYQNQFWGALSYRNQDALVALFGLHLGPSLSVSYVYEYPISKTFTTTGSHEIMLGYTIGARIHSASPRNFW